MLLFLTALFVAAQPVEPGPAPVVPFAEPPELEFKRQVYALESRLEHDPDFAGVKANGGMDISIYFNGDAAAHLARYTLDPRFHAVSVPVSARELRQKADRFLAWAKRRGFRGFINGIDGRESHAFISVYDPGKVMRAARRAKVDLKYLIIGDAVPHYVNERG